MQVINFIISMYYKMKNKTVKKYPKKYVPKKIIVKR